MPSSNQKEEKEEFNSINVIEEEDNDNLSN